tara:strand:- start:1910 stop:6286 length:4377 start_codon:yes stop_codon:yes gene_type:complete
MAERSPLYQQAIEKGGLVIGATVSELPLLPYEKQLIKTIGCSEDEYRYFVAEAIKRGQVRPAEYEGIPDINNGAATPYLIQLAIGIVIGAVSYLLTPKPKAPEAFDGQRQLDSIRGGNRFTPSFGFDTTAELADYNSPIPIVFGLYNSVENVGGLLVTPKLVWSRMLSYGRQQSAKLMFVVGEQGRADFVGPDGIIPPNRAGIFLGNNALDAVYDDNIAFYWKRNTTASDFSRIQVRNKQFGSSGQPHSADPNGGRTAADEDVFLCPTLESDFDKGFSYAFSPANNTEFGVYAPIPNGNAYRVNWRNISIPDKDPEGRLNFDRVKIAGLFEPKKDNNSKSRMAGAGRNYSRRMGVYEYIGSGSETFSNEFQSERNVSVGDRIKYLISNTRIDEAIYEDKATVNDINSEIESQQIAADDAMQLGELFSIGATVWKVIDREVDTFIPKSRNGEDQVIELECIDTSEARIPRIGLVDKSKVIEPGQGFINDNSAGVGAGFFVLTKYARALVRNNRPCDVTEIGIASTVNQQLNGICNFQSLISPEELDQADDDGLNIQSGTISTSVRRSSAFSIYIRKAGLDSSNNEFAFAPIVETSSGEPRIFVITGSKPVRQYNFLRFRHPEASTEYEYKFVPRATAELRSIGQEEQLIQLDADSKDNVVENVSVAGVGTFQLTTKGRFVLKAEIEQVKEMFNDIAFTETTKENTYPTGIAVDGYLPSDVEEEQTTLTSVGFIERTSDPSGAEVGRNGAFTHSIFGSADTSGVQEGQVVTAVKEETLSDNRRVTLEYRATKVRLASDHYAVANGASFVFRLEDDIRVVRSSDNWVGGATFIVRRGSNATGDGGPYNSSNPFVPNHPQAGNNFLSSGIKLRVTGIEKVTKNRGRSQGYYHEIFGNAESKNFGDTATEVRNLTLGARGGTNMKLSLRLKSSVVHHSDHWTGRSKFWATPTIEVVKENTTSSRWEQNEIFDDLVTVGSTNPFYDYSRSGNQIGVRYRVASINKNIVVTAREAFTRGFEFQTQYAELSFYGSLINKSSDTDPEHEVVYVNEISTNPIVPEYNNLTTCGLVLRSSRAFTRLDQLRVWLSEGIPVRRLHPTLSSYEDSSNSTNEGPSNLFTDLVFYLLTNPTAGAGATLNMTPDSPNLIDTASFETASTFLRANKLFCNGAITDKVNVREFVASNAPNFLCNFVIKDGKFGLVPAVPTNPSTGEISLAPVQYSQIFNDGNILEDSFEFEYLSSEERRMFTAAVRYRQERPNKLPEERTVTIALKERVASESSDTDPIETFDLTQFCTSTEHARMAARFFIAIRKLVGHTIRFSTTASGLNLEPGSFIRVDTEATPYDSAKTGTIDSSGNITSVSTIDDGTYTVLYFKSDSDDVATAQMQVSSGKVGDSTFHSSVFTIQQTTNSQKVYMVEQLTFNEDMTVQVVASEYPCDEHRVSELARLVKDENNSFFTTPGFD